MANFSVTRAATSGFDVIGRAPLAVLAWGLVVLLALVAPMAALLWSMIPQFMTLLVALPPPGAEGPSDPAMVARIMQLQGSMMGLNLLSWLGGTFVKAVIAGAVFRAVLEPEQKRFAYLRVGAAEFWLAMVMLVEMVLLMIAYFVLALIVMVLGVVIYLAAAHAGATAQILSFALIGLLGLTAVGALVWCALRLSMAGPLSFTERQFRLFESWAFTRGQTLRLLGTVALLAVFIIVLEVVVYGIMGLGVFATGTRIVGLVEALRDQPPSAWLHALWPFAAVAAVVFSFLGAGAMAVLYAPWATIYGELAASGAHRD